MTYPSRKALISGGRGRRRLAGLDCSRFSSSRICWQTPTHSLQIYERGYSDGELISFSTCSCVLWQKEQRKGSSGLNFFTGVKASSPLGFDGVSTHYSRPIIPLSKRESRKDTNFLEPLCIARFRAQSTSRREIYRCL